MRRYFKDLFYNKQIQSFSYKWYTESNMYDPFAIEFILRNKLLVSNDMKDFMYIEHITNVLPTFAITYNHSVFACLELCDKSKLHQYHYQSQADYIDDKTTIFSLFYEPYFELNYQVVHEPNGPFNPRGIIPIMDEELITRIEREEYFDEENEQDRQWMYLNIIIKYFNHRDISVDDLKFFDRIDYAPVERLFYDMLFLIFCMDRFIEKLLNQACKNRIFQHKGNVTKNLVLRMKY